MYASRGAFHSMLLALVGIPEMATIFIWLWGQKKLYIAIVLSHQHKA